MNKEDFTQWLTILKLTYPPELYNYILERELYELSTGKELNNG